MSMLLLVFMRTIFIWTTEHCIWFSVSCPDRDFTYVLVTTESRKKYMTWAVSQFTTRVDVKYHDCLLYYTIWNIISWCWLHKHSCKYWNIHECIKYNLKNVNVRARPLYAWVFMFKFITSSSWEPVRLS